MPIVINTNVASLNAQRFLAQNNKLLNLSLERLSSGYRINRASDDAAGLQISEALRAQIHGTQKALDNIQDGISVFDITDGVYQTVTDSVQRIRELTVQAANDTNATAQRTAIENEIDQLRTDIDRIASATNFNGINLTGSATPSSYFIQVGANASNSLDRIDITSAIGNISTSTAGINLTAASGQFTSNTAIQSYITQIDAALSSLTTKRATLGAFTNRLQSASQNLSIAMENISNSESRVRNVDVAAESARLTQAQILQQAAASVLSQANQVPQLALQLLKNQ